MGATRNEITGDVIASKVRRAEDMDAYQSGWERIFGKKQIDSDAGWNDIVDSDGEDHD